MAEPRAAAAWGQRRTDAPDVSSHWGYFTQDQLHMRRHLAALFALALMFAFGSVVARAADRYWDINGATAGAGGATPTNSLPERKSRDSNISRPN